MVRHRFGLRIAFVGLLMVGALIFREEPMQAQSGCGCPPYSTMFACMDGADYEHWHCWLECSGYPNPYRDECQNACDQQWFECQSDCFNCPA
jgi:hypothetical protein